MTNLNANEGADVEIDRRYARVGYRISVVVLSIRFAPDVARERDQRGGGCDWNNADLMN